MIASWLCPWASQPPSPSPAVVADHSTPAALTSLASQRSASGNSAHVRDVLIVCAAWIKERPRHTTTPGATATAADGDACVAFVADKRYGGLRVMDVQLENDIAMAPMAPPHSHTLAPASNGISRLQPTHAANTVAALALSTSAPSLGSCSMLWVGWTSGHISLLNLRRPPETEQPPLLLSQLPPGTASQPRSRSPSSSSRVGHRVTFPRYRRWDDVVYAHRAAVHMLTPVAKSCSATDDVMISCSYDMTVVVWTLNAAEGGATACRQLQSLSSLMRSATLKWSDSQSSVASAIDGGPPLHATCRICVDVVVSAQQPDGKFHSRPFTWLVLDGGLHGLFETVEGQDELLMTRCFAGGAVTAATKARLVMPGSTDSDLCETTVLCKGDDQGRLSFGTLTFPLSNPRSDGDAGGGLTAAVVAALSNDNFTDQSTVVHVVSSQRPALGSEVLQVASVSQVVIPSRNAPIRFRCFFAASIAQYAVVVCGCDVSSVELGCVITEAVVYHSFALGPHNSSYLRLRHCHPSSGQHPELSSSSLLLMISSKGDISTLSSVLTVPPQGSTRSAYLPAAGAAAKRYATSPGSVQQRSKTLSHVMDVVHEAKQAVLVVEAALEHSMSEKEQLRSENAVLRQQTAEAREAVRVAEEAQSTLLSHKNAAEAAYDEVLRQLQSQQEQNRYLDQQLNRAASETSTLRAAVTEASERADWNGIKVDESVLQLQEEKERLIDVELQLRAQKDTAAKLTTQNAVLGSRVMQLESLLAETEANLKHQRDAVLKFSGIVDDQQDVIRELREKQEHSAREAAAAATEGQKWKREAERLQEKLQHSRAALDNLVHVWSAPPTKNNQPPPVTTNDGAAVTTPVASVIADDFQTQSSPWHEYVLLRPTALIPPVRPPMQSSSSTYGSSSVTLHPPTDLGAVANTHNNAYHHDDAFYAGGKASPTRLEEASEVHHHPAHRGISPVRPTPTSADDFVSTASNFGGVSSPFRGVVRR